jgi:mitochondrial pyruvate carrier 2
MASTTNSILRASRPLFRQQGTSFAGAAFARQAATGGRFAQRVSFYQQGGRRWQSGSTAGEQQSWFKRMWESEIGFKTVHFW